MNTEIVNPDVGNFIKSLRDIGYTFEIAVADVVDNSIAAKASNIKIYAVPEPEVLFCMLDDGIGMSNKQLIEAMRLASKDPEQKRTKNDLGRFGLGLKTASFSQCKKLTVLSKRNGIISAKQWDLDYISKTNEWLLITPDIEQIETLPFVQVLKKQDQGTLVIWQNIDRYKKDSFTEKIDRLRKHLALVFHVFLEGMTGLKKLNISINNKSIEPFNPFNTKNLATQQIAAEKIKLYDSTISVQPYILPHHSKVSQQEYEDYATEEGYTAAQGFYLYRSNRLLIYGTWWGLHRGIDAHKLVRIKIDILNNQDNLWGIDIKKSTANPTEEIKRDLKRIINQVTEKGSRPYTGRGKRIEDKTMKRFWEMLADNGEFRFALNQEHPILKKIIQETPSKYFELVNLYLKGLQAYLPLNAIQVQLQQNPHKIKQECAMPEEELIILAKKLNSAGLSEKDIDELLKTELFKNRKELLKNGNK